MITKIPEQGAVSALLSSTNRNGLISKIEKHIDDVHKGRGYLSKNIAKEIAEERIRSATALAEIDPSLSQLYNSFSSIFSYSKQARFVFGIDKAVQTHRKLLDLIS